VYLIVDPFTFYLTTVLIIVIGAWLLALYLHAHPRIRVWYEPEAGTVGLYKAKRVGNSLEWYKSHGLRKDPSQKVVTTIKAPPRTWRKFLSLFVVYRVVEGKDGTQPFGKPEEEPKEVEPLFEGIRIVRPAFDALVSELKASRKEWLFIWLSGFTGGALTVLVIYIALGYIPPVTW